MTTSIIFVKPVLELFKPTSQEQKMSFINHSQLANNLEICVETWYAFQAQTVSTN